MRLSKLPIVAVTFASLLIASSAHAQFGKLKDFAKDKMGSQAKDSAKEAAKGPSGEAKAILAPGLKKTTANVAVSRRSSGTPEAHSYSSGGGGGSVGGSGSAATQGGGIQVVSIKVSGADARSFDSVRGYSPCNKVSNFQILSATQMKVTIDLTGSTSKGTCSLYFRSGGETAFTTAVSIQGKK